MSYEDLVALCAGLTTLNVVTLILLVRTFRAWRKTLDTWKHCIDTYRNDDNPKD